MTRSRDWILVAALAMVLAVTGSVRPDGRKDEPKPTTKNATELTCKVYALDNLTARSADPSLGEWVTKTIPEVIDPGSWSTQGGSGKLGYYPQGKLLVVSHEAAVQTKVSAFLDNLKNALPTKRAASEKPRDKYAVVPARLTSRDMDPDLPSPEPIVVPYFEPARHYGHLLLEGVSVKENQLKLKKFSIVYRGDGLIDETLAKLIKALNKPIATPDAPKSAEPIPAPSRTPPLVPGTRPPTPPVTSPAEDEETTRADLPLPKKAQRPRQQTSKPANKTRVVQAKYAPVPRPATPDMPVIQPIIPDEAPHYAHLVVEGLAFSGNEVKLKKLSIVYRGDGIIDENVAKVIKMMQQHAPGCGCGAGLSVPSAFYLLSPSSYVPAGTER